ncbi:pectinesterase 2-like protein [Tanacetum coccineum]
MIYGRRGMKGQQVTITAQGRTDSNQNTGISIQNSRIMAASDLKPVLSSFKTYLGRPWKQYSRTVFLENYIDSLVDPAGWLEWDGNFALNTLYYGEYRNFGPGSSTSRRVKWRGYRLQTRQPDQNLVERRVPKHDNSRNPGRGNICQEDDEHNRSHDPTRYRKGYMAQLCVSLCDKAIFRFNQTLLDRSDERIDDSIEDVKYNIAVGFILTCRNDFDVRNITSIFPLVIADLKPLMANGMHVLYKM